VGYLKKQSQCQNGQNSINQVIAKTYGDYSDFERFLSSKNKPNSNPIYVSPRHCWGLNTKMKKQTQFMKGA
jgi:hypothetical protein